MTETEARAAIARWSKSLFERGLTPGSSGNILLRKHDGFLATPTNACLGFMDLGLAKLDAAGRVLFGDPPMKEMPLHAASCKARPDVNAVVHLHSTYATLFSCRVDTSPEDALAAITPYVVMRVGYVPIIPYTRPGSRDIGQPIAAKAGYHDALLLANHGPVVAAASLDAAIYVMEELEETAKLLVLSTGFGVRRLSQADVLELRAHFPRR
jgi:3-dehydro-4-phosphotetronate decarboxylase